MIENIWSKIWDRIKDDPSKLEMRGFFSKEGELVWSSQVAADHKCASSCCVLGWGWIIGTEEGLDLEMLVVSVDPTFNEVFGEKVPLPGSSTPFYDLCYFTSNEKAREIIRQRAMDEQDAVDR